MGVKLDWDIEGILEPGHQLESKFWRRQTGHVLDADRICSKVLHLLSKPDEGADVVNRAGRIAKARLHVTALALYHLHGAGRLHRGL